MGELEVKFVCESLSECYQVFPQILRVADYGDCSNRMRFTMLHFQMITVTWSGYEEGEQGTVETSDITLESHSEEDTSDESRSEREA